MGLFLVAYHNDVSQSRWIGLLHCQDLSVQNRLAQNLCQRKISVVEAQTKEETARVSSPQCGTEHWQMTARSVTKL